MPPPLQVFIIRGTQHSKRETRRWKNSEEKKKPEGGEEKEGDGGNRRRFRTKKLRVEERIEGKAPTA